MTNRTDVPAAGNNPEIPPVTSPIRVKFTIKKNTKPYVTKTWQCKSIKSIRIRF